MVLHEKYKNVGQMLTWNDIVVIKMDKEIIDYRKKTLGKFNCVLAIFNSPNIKTEKNKLKRSFNLYHLFYKDEESGLVTFNITPTEVVHLPEKESNDITYPLKIQGNKIN